MDLILNQVRKLGNDCCFNEAHKKGKEGDHLKSYVHIKSKVNAKANLHT